MRVGEARKSTDLIAALEDTRKRREDARKGFEVQWWNNIALVAGDHNASWSPTTGRYEDRDASFDGDAGDRKKPKLVINHALSIGRTELAKLTKAHPVMDVIANSDEQEDIAAAKVAKSALDACEWRFKLRKRRKQALWWMIQCGLGAIYIGWDYLNDEAGNLEYVIDPTTGDPTFDPIRQKALMEAYDRGEGMEPSKEEYPLGECEFKVYSPFQLLPDELSLDFDEIQDMITTDVVDVDVLHSIYGRAAKNIKPDSSAALGVMEQRMLARSGVTGGNQGGGTTVEHGVKVHTFFLLPGVYRGNKFLEKGIYMRWCNSNIILDESGAFPYADGRMPFVFFQHVPASTTIWPDSIMTHIRGPNLEVDKTISQLIDNKDYMANPMWRVATQHRIRGEIKNVAGGIVRYRHVPNVPPPEPMPGLQMPAQVENLLQGLRAQILDISGQSEVARGRVPSGVRSGVAVAYLQEEDDSKIAPTVENMEEAIALMGSLTLSRFSQFYSVERTLRYYRHDGVFDVLKFKGADLKNNTDVVTQSGSAMPKSKAARQQYTLELVGLGILQDKKKIEELLEIGMGEKTSEEKAVAQAERENAYMRHGLPTALYKPDADMDEQTEKVGVAVPVKRYHNHELHMQVHTDELLEADYDNLAIEKPEILRLFDEHIGQHQKFLEEAMQKQMEAAMAAKGAPGGMPAGQQPTNGATPPGPEAAAGQPPEAQFRQITDVPTGGGSGELSAMTMRPGPT
jgi:hypothetical protein